MSRSAIVTAVYGSHASLLHRTLATFTKCQHYELHAFVFGDSEVAAPCPDIFYHRVPWKGGFGPQYREVNYRRWEVIDSFDYALVVDGGDVYCLRGLPPAEAILQGQLAAGVVEHRGSRRLGDQFTSTYLNGGVTLWDVARSRELRRQILDRGRSTFRAATDDQLSLNEVLHSRIEEVRILPFLFNYHVHLRARWFDRYWPVAQNLGGVYIVHTPDPLVGQELRADRECAAYPVTSLPPAPPPAGPLARMVRRLAFRWKHRC